MIEYSKKMKFIKISELDSDGFWNEIHINLSDLNNYDINMYKAVYSNYEFVDLDAEDDDTEV